MTLVKNEANSDGDFCHQCMLLTSTTAHTLHSGATSDLTSQMWRTESLVPGVGPIGNAPADASRITDEEAILRVLNSSDSSYEKLSAFSAVPI